ncbi:MAG: CvpA family protein, partial [Thermomicrobiales bacterium]|nr:CvpA family protein [Thermomicrobiales bacterium]
MDEPSRTEESPSGASGRSAGRFPNLRRPNLEAIAGFESSRFLGKWLLIGGLIGIVSSYLVDYTGLTGTDRLLGTVFGLARGAAIIVVLVLAAGLTPLPNDPWWQQSLLLGRFQEGALWLRSA